MNNLPENDLVLGGIDQFLPVAKVHKDILSRVDEVIEHAVETKDIRIIETAIEGLLSISQISGIALAKTLYVVKFQWDKFNQREDYLDWAVDKFGKKEVTVKRYYRVWEMLVSGDVPREYAKKLETMPIRCLIPIATLWSQKFEISPQQWNKLANAPDPSTVNKIIREIKGVEPKENSLQIEWDVEAKSVTGWKNGKPHVIYLQYDEDDEVVTAMLSRLLSDRTMEK